MRIAFAAIPAYGHVFPMVPLAAAFAGAGHEVTFAASDEFATRLPVPVIQSVPEGLSLHDVEPEAKAEMTDRTDPFAWPKALFGVVTPRHVVPHLLTAWDGDRRPDLVIHEGLNVGAARAADQLGIPAVAFQIALASAEFFVEMVRSVGDYPVSLLLDPTPETWRSGPPQSIERVAVRSVAWSDPSAAVSDWLTIGGSRPAAYLTLGTVSFGAVEALRRSVTETAARCSRVLVAAGPDADLAALGEMPTNVRVERYVDQARALTGADVAVHHGGTGTVLACLATGVPQVITPQGADQFLNAARLDELGLGVAVASDAPAGAVGAALERCLTDEDLLAGVAAIRDEIAAMPSPEEVVQTLTERYAVG